MSKSNNTRPIAPVPMGPRGSDRRFTAAEVYKLRQRFMDGESKTDLAEEFAVSVSTIHDAIHGTRTYKDI